MLETIDRDQWSPASENPQVNFNNLPAGDYKLRMRCVDGMGNTSDEIEISFTIREAFFKTWWFTTLWISLLVS